MKRAALKTTTKKQVGKPRAFPGPAPMVTPWKKGVRSVCLFTFDFDADVSWAYRGSKDPVAISMGKFGPKVGVPCILNLLEQFDLKTTFFVPGWVAEQYTSIVEDILRRGHEIGHHGYLHEPGSAFSSADEEEEKIVMALDVLKKTLGCRPVGYRAPFWEFSPNTIPILERNGFEYTSDLMDTLVPQYHVINGRTSSMLNLPVQWVLDDLAHFFYHISARKTILSCRQVMELYQEEFDGIHAYGGLFTLTMHPEATGRPSRILMLKDLIEYVKSHRDVWVTSPGEVVKYWRTVHPAG